MIVENRLKNKRCLYIWRSLGDLAIFVVIFPIFHKMMISSMKLFSILLLLATTSTGGIKSKIKHSSKGSVSSSEDDKRSKRQQLYLPT